MKMDELPSNSTEIVKEKGPQRVKELVAVKSDR